MKTYYVYIWFDRDKNEPYYVGKGSGYRVNKTTRGFGEMRPNTEILFFRKDITNERRAYRIETILKRAIKIKSDGGPLENKRYVDNAWNIEFTPEVRAKMSKSGKGRKQSSETIAKRVAKNKGKKRTQEFKDKQRKNTTKWHKDNPGVLAGENNPMYGVHRYGEDAPMYGKKHSEDTKKLQSSVAMGRKQSPETIAKKVAKQKGQKRSEDFKKNLSEKRKGKNNPMYGRSVYSVWLEKYGKEEADIRDKKWRSRNKKVTKQSEK